MHAVKTIPASVPIILTHGNDAFLEYWRNEEKISELRAKKPRLKWRSSDIHGARIPAPAGLTVCSPNNWLRRLLRTCGAPRSWLRIV